MRFAIVGDNDTARTLREYLRRSGVAVVETRPDYTIALEESTSGESGHIEFNSVDSELEREILRDVRRRYRRYCLSGILIRGVNESDRSIKITVPAKDDEARQAVERGVLQGVLAWLRANEPVPWYRKVFKRKI